MRELMIVVILVIALCFGLACQQRQQSTPPPQDTHTGILKGTHHDQDCDPVEMTVECNGSRPR